MGAIAITDCTVTHLKTSGIKIVKIVTNNEADDGDTIDVSSLFRIGCFAICSGATDNALLVTAPVYTDKSITIPGSTDNEARTIIAIGE